MKVVTVSGAHMIGRRNAGASPQHHLARHEFAVVFAQRPRKRPVSWIADVRAGGPLPAIPKQLLNALAVRRRGMKSSRVEQIPAQWRLIRHKLPFRFRRKPAAAPARKGVGFEKIHMAYRRIKHL